MSEPIEERRDRVELIREEREPLYRAGFRYQTLRWHPELGAETFCIEKDAATGVQLTAGRAALDNLEQFATQ